MHPYGCLSRLVPLWELSLPPSMQVPVGQHRDSTLGLLSLDTACRQSIDRYQPKNVFGPLLQLKGSTAQLCLPSAVQVRVLLVRCSEV